METIFDHKEGLGLEIDPQGNVTVTSDRPVTVEDFTETADQGPG